MNIGIVCASGLGDGLLLQIAARHLRELGHAVTTFSGPLLPLQEWFPGALIAARPRVEDLAAFDAVLLQNDDTEWSVRVRAIALPVYVLYASHVPSKHGPLREGLDVVFDRTRPMAHNIGAAMQRLFPCALPSTDNGLEAPSGLIAKKFPQRVAIHPTSSCAARNWPKNRFLKLADRLSADGWQPVFVTAPAEAAEWNSPLFTSTANLAAFLYESGAFIGNDSGPGHLASNVGLKTVTVGPNLRSHLDLWRPGWSEGRICSAPGWVMEIKALRNRWQFFVPINTVVKQFKTLADGVIHERSDPTPSETEQTSDSLSPSEPGKGA